MSALLLPALAAGSSGQGALYVDDVFSTHLYTGNGSTQTINNGIDLAGKGGLVWIKGRSNAEENALFDTARGVGTGNMLNSELTNAARTETGFTAFNSSGFSLAAPSLVGINTNTRTYASWTFRKAPKFFDVVTYAGNVVAGRQIAHSLGVAPGMIIVKRTDSTGSWFVQHRSANGGTSDWTFRLLLESATSIANVGWLAPTSAIFHASDGINLSGATYVAYLFAHDPSAEGIIQCGSFTTDSSGNATVNSGWANGSQFAMIKAASTTGDWEMYDTARTSAWSGNDARLRANLSNAEDYVARISASGTSITFAGLTANSTYIYMAIRSPS